MRPIDADKLHYHRVWIASIKKGEYNGMKSAVVVFADEIDKNKKARVDAVPVVRCAECGNRDPEDHKCRCGAMERQGCPFPVDDDYFCKYGDRKGGDE